MPVAAKINAAHPVSPETASARERLLALLADDRDAIDKVNTLSESRLTVRALSCSKNGVIGRLDSVSAVKLLPMDVPCFQAQDRELEKFYAIRRIGTLLSKPALRPLKAAGQIALLPPGKLSYIISGALARDAGVGVLLDERGNGVIVEMPGATPISQLPNSGLVGQPGTYVSPNGRVIVFNPMSQGPVFVEAETGNRIWHAPGGGAARLLAWLPEVDGFVLAGVEGNVMLADGLAGTLEPHPSAIKNSAYGAHIAGSPPRLLMGTARELVLVEHQRTPDGIRATVVNQYAIQAGPGITSGHPVPMHSGHRVVYATMRDIGWLDLDSGASGTWRSAPRFGIPFAKLDETHIMFDSNEPGSMVLQPWSFDIANETVAPIDLGKQRGLIVDIGDRVGFLRRGNEAWFGDQVRTGEAQSLDKAVAEFELQRQLAKLQAPGDSVTVDGRAGQALPIPGLGDVPTDAEVHLVGVYEGRRDAGRTSGHPVGNVRIVARATGRPIVLVLTSYEPVSWVVVNVGARISAVLLSGNHPSTVAGIGNVPVLRIGSTFAYAAGSTEYVQLRQAVAQYTGAREIRSFQGSYTGSEFSVGGR